MTTIIWNKPLAQDSYLIYAARYYTGSGYWNEFLEDLDLFKQCSKLIVQKINANKVTLSFVQKVLNSYISLGNVFSGNSLARLAFYSSNPIAHSFVKTILYYMKRLPTSIPERNLSEVSYDTELLDLLGRI